MSKDMNAFIKSSSCNRLMYLSNNIIYYAKQNTFRILTDKPEGAALADLPRYVDHLTCRQDSSGYITLSGKTSIITESVGGMSPGRPYSSGSYRITPAGKYTGFIVLNF
ncbi:MAG: hypothetical protein GXO83_05735 [Chlorobi bacterium]|nr:hypothetical protein [Chlorobiota bacterium]